METQSLDPKIFLIDSLPNEIWEVILSYLDVATWYNLAKAFVFVKYVIEGLKKKEIEKCKKSLKQIPFECFVELQQTSRKHPSKLQIIESYVKLWKLHSVDKARLHVIEYSRDNESIDCINISGRWIFLFVRKGNEGMSGLKMVHLDSLQRHELQLPWLLVEKISFIQSTEIETCPCHKAVKSNQGNIERCWCNKDLAHDYLQVHLPINLRILQSGTLTHFINLHSMEQTNGFPGNFVQRNYAKIGDFFVSCGKFRLIFQAKFEFDPESFKSRVRVPQPHVYVFEGDPGALPKRRRLLNVSVALVPNMDTFRVVLHLLDQVESKYKILFLLGPSRILLEIEVPCLVQSWLFRGSLLIGLCSEGSLILANHRGKLIDPRRPRYYTAACLRVNLLILGTRGGSLLVYRLDNKFSQAVFELNFKHPCKEFQMCSEPINQILFVPSTLAPEILVVSESNKLYHVKL